MAAGNISVRFIWLKTTIKTRQVHEMVIVGANLRPFPKVGESELRLVESLTKIEVGDFLISLPKKSQNATRFSTDLMSYKPQN